MNAKDVEIECKFLLSKVPDVNKSKTTQIEQGYLSKSQDVEFRFENAANGVEFVVSQCCIKKKAGECFKEISPSTEVRVPVESTFVKKVRDLMRTQGQDVVVRVRLENVNNEHKEGEERVKNNEGIGYLTIKGRFEGFGCPEIEIKMDMQRAQEILSMMSNVDKISKKRHYVNNVNNKGAQWTVDEFCGDLTGLVLAEIEFESEKEAKALSEKKQGLPVWNIDMVDVTKDKVFKNVNLIGKKMEELKDYVKELLSSERKVSLFESGEEEEERKIESQKKVKKTDEDIDGNACGWFKDAEAKGEGLGAGIKIKIKKK